MLRLNALLSLLVLALSACVESPPPSSQPVVTADMATDSDTQDMGGEDVVIDPDLPDIDEPACSKDEDCGTGKVCKVDNEPGRNECVECVEANDCTDGVCKDDNTCVACIVDTDCGAALTCSDTNECIGCRDGAACPDMANRCDESERAGTCVQCLGDGEDTLCGGRPCDPESRRCVPCLPGDEGAGIDDTCAEGKHCKVVDEDDSLKNECVECLDSDDCATGGCDLATNTCVNCVADVDCDGDKVCTRDADPDDRMCVTCLEGTCDNGVCKEDANDPGNNKCVTCLSDDECSDNDVCNPATNECVECVDNGDCDDKVCKPSSNICVECVENDDCTNGDVCDPSNTCVECLTNGDCTGEVCDTNISQCVPCLGDMDCTGTNQCQIKTDDSTKNACVTCVNNSVCQDRTASLCDGGTNSCVQCTDPSHCNHLGAIYNYCDTASGCIECYGPSEETDCVTTFCDLSTNICSPDSFGTTPDLTTCAGSNDCTPGSRCVPLMYKGNALDNYCMPLTTFSAAICPGPYGAQKQTRTTVEGHSVLVCMIDETRTTPEAIKEASFQVVCTLTGSQCVDQASQCTASDGLNFVCSYPCVNNAHCPTSDGLTCRCPGLTNSCPAPDRRCLP